MKAEIAPSRDTSGITQWLRSHLTNERIYRFLDNEGIDEYSTVSAASVVKMLDTNRFPEAHHVDCQWAISEAGAESIRTYEPELRLLVSVIYCYCHRIAPLGTPVESQYYSMGLDAVAEIDSEDLNHRYLKFLEKIYGIDKRAENPGDFFVVLSIALILSMGAAGGSDLSQDVTAKLESLSMEYRTVADLTVAIEGLSDWYSLVAKLAGDHEQKQRLLAFLPTASENL